MKKIFFILLVFSVAIPASAQVTAKYFELVDQAKMSFDKKEYKKSALLYVNAFKFNAGKAYSEDRYNAARSWAMAGNKDSAFAQLLKVATLYDYTNYNELTLEKSFTSLQTDNRWLQVTEMVKQNIGKSDAKLNSGLVILLDSVYREHHSYRLTEVRIKNQYGAQAAETKEIQKTIQHKDSINLFIVLNIFEKYGWLGKNIVGDIGNNTLAIIIEHADLPIQEKYLPLAREAFKKNNIEPYDIALLEDKVALRQGKKQSYGSVVITLDNKNYVAPIEDVANVDKRRMQLGLKSMNEYLKSWGSRWDVEKYKKDLPLFEKEKIVY
jgi:hypothetical protein